jgi:hypothetical protein
MIDRIKELLPAHYQEYAPRFIKFIEKYYEWLYRKSGLSTAEIANLTNDTSWLQKDIDRFIASGRLKYLDTSNPTTDLNNALLELNNTANPGNVSDNLLDNFLLENDFKGFLSADGLTPYATGNKDVTVEFNTVENGVVDSWFNSMGFDRVKKKDFSSLYNIDEVLMISLLKQIYAIKGTEASIKLFFNLFFDEDISIYYPKLDIAVLDENFTLDDPLVVIRDDQEFQEFSYILLLRENWLVYKELFESIYMKNVHPSGFRVGIESIYSLNMRRLGSKAPA